MSSTALIRLFHCVVAKPQLMTIKLLVEGTCQHKHTCDDAATARELIRSTDTQAKAEKLTDWLLDCTTCLLFGVLPDGQSPGKTWRLRHAS